MSGRSPTATHSSLESQLPHRPAQQRQGFAVELTRAAYTAASALDSAVPFIASIAEHNLPSRKVAQRLGLTDFAWQSTPPTATDGLLTPIVRSAPSPATGNQQAERFLSRRQPARSALLGGQDRQNIALAHPGTASHHVCRPSAAKASPLPTRLRRRDGAGDLAAGDEPDLSQSGAAAVRLVRSRP